MNLVKAALSYFTFFVTCSFCITLFKNSMVLTEPLTQILPFNPTAISKVLVSPNNDNKGQFGVARLIQEFFLKEKDKMKEISI